MSESISTHYLKGGFAASDDVILSETTKTRTIFRPGIHRGGVRGHIIRQKVGADGKTWKDVNEVNFTTMPADCGVSIELDTAATQKLHDRLSQLYEVQKNGVATTDREYIVAKADEVLIVDDKTKRQAMQELLQKGYSEEFWSELMRKKPDLAAQLAAAKIQHDREQAIRTFADSLATHPDDEDYWQNFFEVHPWMLQSAFSAAVFMLSGETYLGGKMPVGRQGTGGVATDFLFADDSTKSFAVVEIKTPHSSLTGTQYRGKRDTGYDNEIYSIHSDLSGGLVQVRNQITVAVENFQSVLKPGFKDKINRIHPKGVLIIGTTAQMDQRKRDSFNQFRHALHSITVITFDELLNRLKLMFTGTTGTSQVNRAKDVEGDNLSPF